MNVLFFMNKLLIPTSMRTLDNPFHDCTLERASCEGWQFSVLQSSQSLVILMREVTVSRLLSGFLARFDGEPPSVDS